MKFVPLLISSLSTILLIIVFDTRWGPAPAFGEFLSPQYGFWQNAEPVDKDFAQDLQLPGLKDPAEIYLDDRLVPHVFAGNEERCLFYYRDICTRNSDYGRWNSRHTLRPAASANSSDLRL